ncbi:hypothetical protein BaRGS_00021922 [Batillaria attramentaria]|uniref:Uncharacterized protein n=1 Tax=Batillaria attramentaria TaxID=370345 RepID=A0ABD0KIE5_9CAEN
MRPAGNMYVGRRAAGMRLAGTSFSLDPSRWERLRVTSNWNASSGERLGGASCNWDGLGGTSCSWDRLGGTSLTGMFLAWTIPSS